MSIAGAWNRASPVGFAGPKRVSPPAIAFDNLPRIDVVPLSHNHYDHLDIATLRRLVERDQPLNTPSGYMEGRYHMIGEDGNGFTVAIPRFPLTAPAVTN